MKAHGQRTVPGSLTCNSKTQHVLKIVTKKRRPRAGKISQFGIFFFYMSTCKYTRLIMESDAGTPSHIAIIVCTQ